MLRWLTRLFKQHVEAEADPAIAPAPAAPPEAVSPPTLSDAAVAVDEEKTPELAVVKAPVAVHPDPDPKETCPTCGRTSVFAGPPGQRFCTYCALRDELFDRAAAQE